jgi:hypothetical protein
VGGFCEHGNERLAASQEGLSSVNKYVRDFDLKMMIAIYPRASLVRSQERTGRQEPACERL